MTPPLRWPVLSSLPAEPARNLGDVVGGVVGGVGDVVGGVIGGILGPILNGGGKAPPGKNKP